MTNFTNYAKLLLPIALVTALSGCFHDDDDDPVVITPPPVVVPEPEPTEYSYEIMVSNLTYAQPLSPMTVTLHGDSKMWTMGQAASTALELLAEGGDNSEFIAQADVLESSAGEGVVLPGATDTVSISTTDEAATHLTFSTMLVNTNDAFSGLTGLDLSTLAVDEPKTWTLNVYDAGTEMNSEVAGTIPGPADGGAGFDMTRDDVNFIAIHPGVVSQDDGLSTSVLTQAHRFDNPAVKITITRTK